ncbi:unnamed protein product [Chrysoparadoxa australica]
MKQLVEDLGLLQQLTDLQVVHVTGTKGKGSCCAFTESILRRKGFRTCLFTSPHLLQATERIRINGSPIPRQTFAKYVFDVESRIKAGKGKELHVGYFQFLTLVGLWAAVHEDIQVLICEVGMGGRYDATNVLPSPTVCGVVLLDLDHTNVLGNTLAEIAWEKGGIYKRGSKAFSVVQQSNEPLQVLQKCADEAGAELMVVEALPDIDARGARYEVGLAGRHQRVNAGMAVALVESLLGLEGQDMESFRASEEVHQGLRETQWPGRCQRLKGDHSRWCLDGAHTVESMRQCLDWFRLEAGNEVKGANGPTLVFMCGHERNLFSLIQPLAVALASSTQLKNSPGGEESLQSPFFSSVLFPVVSSRPSRFAYPTVSQVLESAGVSPRDDCKTDEPCSWPETIMTVWLTIQEKAGFAHSSVSCKLKKIGIQTSYCPA